VEFVNHTSFPANWCLGVRPDGRELLIVVAKATYRLPQGDEVAELAEEQVPLVKADEFTGEPGLSATLYESDFAHHKPMCDVLVVGSAHAPGKGTRKLTVGLEVGPIRKRFEVLGDRVWSRRWFRTVVSGPKPFKTIPLSYDRAYGGTDTGAKPDKVRTYPENPVGVGYYPLSRGKKLIGRPLPNTQEIGKGATRLKGKLRPMSFGPMSRNFAARVPFAGTYDQRWLDERAPHLPRDFDYGYFQSAPADQQMPYPAGGEEVRLVNLTASGVMRFRLPRRDLPILIVPHEGDAVQLDPVVDTVVIEPDLGRMTSTWRASRPLSKDIFEVRQVVIARTLHDHAVETRWQDKVRYANLAEMVRARRGAR